MVVSRQVKWRITLAALMGLGLFTAQHAAQQSQQNTDEATSVTVISQVLGRPTDHSIALNVLAPDDLESYVEFGTAAAKYSSKTATMKSKSKTPFEVTLDRLKPNARYYYRLRYREAGKGAYLAASEYTFQTQRPPGSIYVFDVQSDSHPERVGQMFDAGLYARTMASVRKDRPDFYITMGDDFSVDQMRGVPRNAASVAHLYINQRQFLGMDGCSTPVFLVNGNHEQAAKYLLDGTPNNNAVWAGVARNRYYPNPAPDSFYTGDTEPVKFIGLLRDYYAFTWGDALFVSLDPYWHSPVVVDNALGEGPGGGQDGGQKKDGQKKGQKGGGRGGRNMWDITHGDAQYQWLRKTLSESKAKYKFVFAHHVMGTGRGGVDIAGFFEWGGKNRQGQWEFDTMRPGWELPIHQLMAKYGVSIFFQGHDHLFVRQQKDGVIYQETPTPADPNYASPNDSAYQSGDHLPAAGHLRVTVSPQSVKVEYVRSWLPQDENAEHKQDQIAFTYSVAAGKPNQ